MERVRNFVLVVLNLIGELWIGGFRRNPDYYDRYTEIKTKAGYAAFVALATIVALGIVTWLYLKLH
ncbi:hypothetical protein [Paenibacillus sp. J2TS4]|uniref:hypothetical protein n=1 Tax=Paenibacillus sp. J2TS4 TaxID=2807194 RepID=UPI001B10D3EC|nr:hypothetical protein [Paenibacillus sp. J2TS4]GIP32647.1 hypothetical protein J2TS4_18570 [Paenibacillus sp. J2TS4]